MKKILILLSVLLLCLALFCSCQTDKPPTQPPPVDPGSCIHDWGTNNVCTLCGTQLSYTDTLTYTLNSDGASYTLTGFTAATDGDIVIPPYHKGLPVTVIGEMALDEVGGDAWEDYMYGEGTRPPMISVTIPATVTEIGEHAFAEAFSVTEIIFAPNSQLKTIGDDAFAGCALSSIELPEGLTTIGGDAFIGTILTHITIPSTVTEIKSGAFDECITLIEICNLSALNITAGSAENGCVARYAKNVYTATEGESKISTDENGYVFFQNDTECYLLWYEGTASDLTLPTQFGGMAYEIHPFAFSLKMLHSITLPQGMTSIPSFAFYVCLAESITVPEGVTSIGDRAFWNCRNLKSIALPASLQSIGSYAFDGCPDLSTIRFAVNSNLREIGYRAFSHCYSLESITLPEGLITIASDAFSWCKGLKSITVPTTVTAIGQGAFYGCDALESMTLPCLDGDYLAKYFSYLPQTLTQLTVSSGRMLWNIYPHATSYFTDASGSHMAHNIKHIVLGKDVTVMGGNPLLGCRALESITVESGNATLQSIGNCLIDTATDTVLAGCKRSVIPADGSVTAIGTNAFAYLTGLYRITVPASITEIADGAFSGCSILEVENLSDLSITAGDTAHGGIAASALNVYTATEGSSIFSTVAEDFLFVDNGTVCMLVAYTGEATDLVLPVLEEGKTYTIWNSAFAHSCLTGITIPACVSAIGDYAFSNCTDLAKVRFAVDSGCAQIGRYAFQNCTALTEITVPPSITNIWARAFEGCSNLTAVYITDLTAWCGIAFDYSFTLDCYYASPCYYAHNLYLNGSLITDLVVPDGITAIGGAAFAGCCFTSVTIPQSVTSIGYNAFRECRALTTLTLNNGITSIGSDAFYGCSKLVSVTIPQSVTEIGSQAFYGCNDLGSVTFAVTTGWGTTRYDSIDPNGLALPDTAAYYLKEHYCYDTWVRNE